MALRDGSTSPFDLECTVQWKCMEFMMASLHLYPITSHHNNQINDHWVQAWPVDRYLTDPDAIFTTT